MPSKVLFFVAALSFLIGLIEAFALFTTGWAVNSVSLPDMGMYLYMYIGVVVYDTQKVYANRRSEVSLEIQFSNDNEMERRSMTAGYTCLVLGLVLILLSACASVFAVMFYKANVRAGRFAFVCNLSSAALFVAQLTTHPMLRAQHEHVIDWVSAQQGFYGTISEVRVLYGANYALCLFGGLFSLGAAVLSLSEVYRDSKRRRSIVPLQQCTG